MSDLHRYDIGTDIVITVLENGLPIDISAAAQKVLILQKPDGTIVEKDMQFVTDGSDGKLVYTTAYGDLDQIGKWLVQARIRNSLGEWSSSTTSFKVKSNLSISEDNAD